MVRKIVLGFIALILVLQITSFAVTRRTSSRRGYGDDRYNRRNSQSRSRTSRNSRYSDRNVRNSSRSRNEKAAKQKSRTLRLNENKFLRPKAFDGWYKSLKTALKAKDMVKVQKLIDKMDLERKRVASRAKKAKKANKAIENADPNSTAKKATSGNSKKTVKKTKATSVPVKDRPLSRRERKKLARNK